MHSSQDCWGLQLLSHFGASESVTQKHSWHCALGDLQAEDLLPSQQKLWGWRGWCGNGWGWIQSWISLQAQQLQLGRQEGRLRDERIMLKSTVPVLGFPAAVLVAVRLPTEVAELLILGRKQNCPLLLSRLILPELPSLAEHGRLPGLCQRSCSFSSAPSGGFPSEPEFIPLFKSDIHTCFVAGLSEVFYRTCRPRRSLRGGILIKKRNMCLGKKGEALWIQSLTEPTFGLAVWPEPHGRHKHTFH